MRANKLTAFSIIIASLSILLTCAEKKITENENIYLLRGSVYQRYNGFVDNISGAEITVGSYKTISDSAGHYAIEIPAGTYTIMGSHDLYDTTVYVEVEINKDRVYSIIMNGPTYTVSGYVKTATDEAIEGTIISIKNLKDTTNSAGFYAIGDVPQGKKSINFESYNYYILYDSVEIGGDDIVKNVNLVQSGFTVYGKVINENNEPIEGAVVNIGLRSDTTDNNGSFAFPYVPEGQREISCDYADYNIFTDTFEVAGTDVQQNVLLEHIGYTVSGSVYHSIDGLIENIEVVLDDTLYDTTDINGEFSITGVIPGEHSNF